MPADAAARLKRLYKYIEDAADDAHAFASQAASDAKRHHLGTSTGLTGDEEGSAAQAATNDAATDDKVRLFVTSFMLILLAWFILLLEYCFNCPAFSLVVPVTGMMPLHFPESSAARATLIVGLHLPTMQAMVLENVSQTRACSSKRHSATEGCNDT